MSVGEKLLGVLLIVTLCSVIYIIYARHTELNRMTFEESCESAAKKTWSIPSECLDLNEEYYCSIKINRVRLGDLDSRCYKYL